MLFLRVFGAMHGRHHIDSIKCIIAAKARILLESIAAMKPVRMIGEKLRKAYAPSHDTEAGTMITSVTNKQVDWPQVVVTFCFGGGIGFSFVSDQIRRQAPISFDVMSVLIALAFSFVFLSNFIPANHPVTAGLLEFLGVLFAAAALFTALCIPLPPFIKYVVWTIFSVSVLTISIVNVVSA